MTRTDNDHNGQADYRNPHLFFGMTHGAFFGIAGLAIVVGVLAIVLTIAGTHRSNENRALAAQGQQAHAALCALKNFQEVEAGKAQVQLDKSKDFLATHPNALPGVPAAVLQQSQDAQQKSINRQFAVAVLLDKQLSCGTG